VAIPMMYLMPWLAVKLGLSQEVAGAWLGGTIDTTGAVVAAGKFLGDTAETYSVIIKSAQNVLLGVAALAISIYWSYRGTANKDLKPSAGILWERFPKFVIGFALASLVFSFFIPAPEVKALTSTAKGLREMMFSLAFVCIGLETDFRSIFTKENKKYITTFLVAQLFNILVTLLMAYLLFDVLRS
jgi:Predicted membrane protein